MLQKPCFMSCHFKTNAHAKQTTKLQFTYRLNNIHTDVISSLIQHLVSLSYSLGVELQCTSGCWALLPFPSTGLDRETHTTWLNSHKLSASPVFFSLSVSLSLSLTPSLCLSTELEEAGSEWFSDSDYKSTVLLLLMRSLKGVYRSVFTLLKGWADWYF